MFSECTADIVERELHRNLSTAYVSPVNAVEDSSFCPPLTHIGGQHVGIIDSVPVRQLAVNFAVQYAVNLAIQRPVNLAVQFAVNVPKHRDNHLPEQFSGLVAPIVERYRSNGDQLQDVDVGTG